jgi:hypothetical protein
MTFREPEHRSFNRIGFDLDDTLAEGVWPSPSIGKPIQKALDMVNFYWEKGYALYVFTSRPALHKRAILDWLRDNQLDHMFYDVITDKPQFDFLIDDKALNFNGEVGVQSDLERLAEIEHDQWMTWTKTVAARGEVSAEQIAKWAVNWKPYDELTDEVKEYDREWARKVQGEGCSECSCYIVND